MTQKRKNIFSIIPDSQKGETNTILVILLVVASFLIGSLWTRVQFMQKESTTTAGSVAGTESGNAAAPQTPPTQAVGPVPEITDADHYRGDKNANLALIEYSDLECPFCKTFHPTMQQVLDEYKGKVVWIYRHYPLSFHQNAQKEAEAAECAAKLGGNDTFWKYVDAIYERTTANGTGFALDKLAPLAVEVGLNETQFTECLDGGEMTKTVQDDMSGGTQAGVSGTPGTIVLNRKTKATQMIPGALPYIEVKKIVDQML